MHFIVVFHVKPFTRLYALEETASSSLYSRRDKFFKSFIKVLRYSLLVYLSIKGRRSISVELIFENIKCIILLPFRVFKFCQTSESKSEFMLKITICDSCIIIANTQ